MIIDNNILHSYSYPPKMSRITVKKSGQSVQHICCSQSTKYDTCNTGVYYKLNL